jgi:DUF1680 family protein
MILNIKGRGILRILVGVLLTTGLGRAGDLTERYQLTLDRVLTGGPPVYTPELVLADLVPVAKRLFTDYSGDVSGRYVGALALAEIESGRSFEALDGIVPRMLVLQKEPGYFGAGFNETKVAGPEMALLWGNGRLLIGLLEYYRVKPQPQVLAAARRIGDFLVRVAPVLNTDNLRKRIDSEEAIAAGYICWTQTIEGLAELYRATKDPRYLQVADQTAWRTVRCPKQHSHGFLTSMRGIVALYKVTGEAKYLEKAEREWQGVIDSGNLLVQGAVPEAFAPDIARTEGCAEADWLRLSLALWQLTGKAQYIEQAERTLFNEFAMNQFQTGDFGERPICSSGTPVGAGPDGLGSNRAWFCCTLHGLRGFADVFSGVFRAKAGSLWFDLPVDGRGKAEGFAVQVTSELGRSGTVELVVTESDQGTHSLFVRRPAWASGMEIAVNAAAGSSAGQDGFVEIRRQWKSGDTVSLTYAMQTRAERKNGRIALFHGPWLLGVDEETNPYFRDEPWQDQENKLLLKPAADGTVELERVSSSAGRFSYPVAHFRMKYLPGGYPLQPATALLRPIAEQTGGRSTAWNFWFQVAP